jgi:hypothetical protein
MSVDNMISASKFIVIPGLLATIVYLGFFRKPTVIQQTPIVAETPIRRLSAFVDAHMDKILCPLAPEQTLMPSQELRQIQQTLTDLKNKAIVDSEQRLYGVGIVLCNQMLQAIAVRESHNSRIADLRAKGFDSPLSSPKDRKADARKKQDFFESSVARSWETQASKLKEQIQKQYDYMRLLERTQMSGAARREVL